MKKRIIISILLVLMLIVPLPVFASEAGSLEIGNVSEAAIVYYVADSFGGIAEEFTGAISGKDDIEELSPALANSLREHVREYGLKGDVGRPDESGSIFFDGLGKGYYLVMSSTEPGEFAPFLISIPMTIIEDPIYDIKAMPKAETPEEDGGGDEPGSPIEPEPNIPQTAGTW